MALRDQWLTHKASDWGGDDDKRSVASTPSSSTAWDHSSSWQGWYNNDRSWYWGKWPRDDWGSWWAHHDQAKAKAWQHADPTVQSLLSRGHTIDRLTDDQLAEIVRQVDEVKRERSKLTAEQPAAKKTTADESKDQEPPAKKTRADESKDHSQEPPAKKAKADESKDASHAESKPEAAPSGSHGDPPQETKDERKKRLHARYMRFSRSLVSHVLN